MNESKIIRILFRKSCGSRPASPELQRGETGTVPRISYSPPPTVRLFQRQTAVLLSQHKTFVSQKTKLLCFRELPSNMKCGASEAEGERTFLAGESDACFRTKFLL